MTALVNWTPMESICMECRQPMIREVPRRRYCNPCGIIRQRRHQKIWRIKNISQIRSSNTESRQKHYLKNRNARIEYQKKYNTEHAERIKTQQKVWYQKKKQEAMGVDLEI